ncbi:MAG TPA: S8 family serine peptidase [Pseudonocardiaceae bacterium]|jgi:subtilisin family serine protease|nr:S8 family serine peptidase [Pseudonocardiaceae bacterium]
MTAPAQPTDLPDTFLPDQLVVHLPYRDLVIQELHRLGVEPASPPKEDERLGLALLTLVTTDRKKKVTDLDPLLAQLRAVCGLRYGGWVPLLGKNRQVESVFGLPQPKSHALDDLARTQGPLPLYSAPGDGRGVRVGVLDTKIIPHPDLVGRFVADPTEIHPPADGPIELRAPHATFVTSVIIGRAQSAVVEAIGVLGDDGLATAWDTVTQMMAFADAGVDILNLSLGCRTADGRPPLLMARAAQLLSQRMLLVAAAGNHHLSATPNAPTWPAALPDVVAVGALDPDGTPSDFSPRLPWLTCSAPGRDIVGAYTTGPVKMLDGTVDEFKTGYAEWSGTSFATAAVSGAVAARTVPGKVSPRDALRALLAEPGGVVRPWVLGDDGSRA